MTGRRHGDQGPHYDRVGVRARARTALRGLRDPFDLPDRQRLARRQIRRNGRTRTLTLVVQPRGLHSVMIRP